MAEALTPADVSAYAGRLDANDPEVARALSAALARARRYCHWHVYPVKTETFTLDGDGSERISIPTLNVVVVLAVTVNGESVDVSEIQRPAHSPWVFIRNARWPRGYRNVTITVSHGYTAAEAPDFREAVLRMVDASFAIAENEGRGALISRQVDDATDKWSANGGMDSDVEAMLDPFRRKWFCA